MEFLFLSGCLCKSINACLCMWDLFLPAEGITKIVCKRAKVFYKTTRNDKGERE